jgi:hypothetical protein
VIVASHVLGSHASLQFNGAETHISLAAGLDSLVLDRRSGLVTAHWSIWAPPVDDRPWTQGEWASGLQNHATRNSRPEVWYYLVAAMPAPGEQRLLLALLSLPLVLVVHAGVRWGWGRRGGGGTDPAQRAFTASRHISSIIPIAPVSTPASTVLLQASPAPACPAGARPDGSPCVPTPMSVHQPTRQRHSCLWMMSFMLPVVRLMLSSPCR